MAFITWLHNWQLSTPFGLLIPTPLAVVTLVLFVWSIGPAIKLKVGRPMVWWLRLTWVLTLLPAVTGTILALGGGKVASAIATTNPTIIQKCAEAGAKVAGGITRYCNQPDPKRNLEHWMYAGLAIVSLYIIEVLIAGKLVSPKIGLRVLPLVAFFLWGCCFMVYRVAVLPGASAGT